MEYQFKKLQIEKGDIVVVKVSYVIDSADAERLKQLVIKELGADVRCLVLGANVDIGVLKMLTP